MHVLRFHPDGQSLAGLEFDGGLRLWDLRQGALRWTAERVLTQGEAFAFSPDGHQLVVAGRRGPYPAGTGALAVLDAHTGQIQRVIDLAADCLRSVCFSPDGTLLAAGADGGQVLLWRVADGALLRILDAYAAMVNTLLFTADGGVLGVLGLAEWVAPEERWNEEHDVYPTLRFWRLADGVCVKTLTHNGDVGTVLLSPDGRLLVTTIADQVLFWGIP